VNPLRHLLSHSFDNVSGGSAGNATGVQGTSAYSFSNYSKGNGQHNSFAGMNNNTYDYHNSVSGYGGATQGTAYQRNNSSQHQPTVGTSMVVTNSNITVTLPSHP